MSSSSSCIMAPCFLLGIQSIAFSGVDLLPPVQIGTSMLTSRLLDERGSVALGLPPQGKKRGWGAFDFCFWTGFGYLITGLFSFPYIWLISPPSGVPAQYDLSQMHNAHSNTQIITFELLPVLHFRFLFHWHCNTVSAIATVKALGDCEKAN